jgi:hypothetical protein
MRVTVWIRGTRRVEADRTLAPLEFRHFLRIHEEDLRSWIDEATDHPSRGCPVYARP